MCNNTDYRYKLQVSFRRANGSYLVRLRGADLAAVLDFCEHSHQFLDYLTVILMNEIFSVQIPQLLNQMMSEP